jgi:hypothetical protein
MTGKVIHRLRLGKKMGIEEINAPNSSMNVVGNSDVLHDFPLNL